MRVLCFALVVSVLTAICGTARAQTGQPLYILSQDPGTGARAFLLVPTAGPQAFTVTQRLPLGGTPDDFGIDATGAIALVRDTAANSLEYVALTGDLAGTVLGKTTGLSTPSGFTGTAGDKFLYIANQAADTISVVPLLGPQVNQIVATITGFDQPEGVAAVTQSTTAGLVDTIYVANSAANTVSVVATAGAVGNVITATIPVGTGPRSLAWRGGILFSLNTGSNDISVVNLSRSTVTNTITGVNQPRSMFFSQDGTTLYVLSAADNEVDVIPLAGSAIYTVTSRIPVGRNPTQVRVTSDASEAYIVNTGDNTISVFSLVTNTVERTFGGLGVIKAHTFGTVPTSIVGAVLPGSRSVREDGTATVFATLINGGASLASGCRINLPSEQSAPISLTTVATDALTNKVVGVPDRLFQLFGGEAQTFLLSFKASATVPMTTVPLQFFCSGIAPATLVPGVNTVDLAFGATATTDVIALAATASGDGIVRIPLSANGAAFAVASANVGAAGALSVSADTGDAALPIALGVCQTDPTTGQCLAIPVSSVPISIAAGGTPTFSVFATATAGVAAAPGAHRIFVHFRDGNGVSHGATSVAVQTE
ncbi:MAG TPA: YncE family protein [Aliidongia sp.]|uniref:YncE family protein n=1 Tax=Aliidongia sp. TaxID=1914230 RepID=UPI002DDCD5BE|nr:YncE family protein [Aliidongia sp.]HEV2675949.1 YncE family protein [Aliidongia sp.]